jgi:hypothetical protein
MRWEKRGLVIRSPPRVRWAASHAMVPFVERADEQVRIYFSGRDGEGRSVTGFAEGDPFRPQTLRFADQPVLEPGPLGTFDDSGAMGSCLVAQGERKHLYYIGWSRGVSVPFYTFIGCAVSEDGGLTFERVSAGPVLERSNDDPYLTTSPWVILDDGRWQMWYASGRGWHVEPGKPKHYYVHLRYAESEDGLSWHRTGRVAIDLTGAEEYAIGRPCVVKTGGGYRMWYSYRGDSYRIGYAESEDGVVWERMDSEAGIDVSPDGWDSEMIEYPCVFQHGSEWLMLYNGNGYGATGVGLAVGRDLD